MLHLARNHVSKELVNVKTQAQSLPNVEQSLPIKNFAGGKQTIPSLFTIALKFVSENIIHIDCLENFPELMGYEIFKAAIQNQIFISDYFSAIKVAEIFTLAYRDLVLSSLCLPNLVLIINKFLDPLLRFTVYLSALDLRSCHLGDNHEIISHIGKIKSLKKLCLKDNCLTDRGMRKVTLPARMFRKGPLYLEELDVSDNMNLTDAFVVWLPKFKCLSVLVLHGTSVTEHGLLFLQKKCNLIPVRKNLSLIETKGWAAPVIQQWMEYCQDEIKNSNALQLNKTFYAKAKINKIQEGCLQHLPSVPLQSQQIIKKIHNEKVSYFKKDSAKSVSVSSSINLECNKISNELKIIKENLFSQYM